MTCSRSLERPLSSAIDDERAPPATRTRTHVAPRRTRTARAARARARVAIEHIYARGETAHGIPIPSVLPAGSTT